MGSPSSGCPATETSSSPTRRAATLCRDQRHPPLPVGSYLRVRVEFSAELPARDSPGSFPSVRRITAVLALAGALSLSTSSASAGVDFGTLREKASTLAERTYINARSYGKRHRIHRRHFHLFGQPSYTVKAEDGSLFTGFSATLASADGTGDIVLLFDEERFVGWASNRMAGNLGLARRGNDLLVRYAIYRSRDAICCPSGYKAIVYRWADNHVVRGGKPPRIYGEVGPPVHLES